MLKRRGVIAAWETRSNAPSTFDLESVFHSAVKQTAADSGALVFGDSLAMTIDGIDSGWSVRARFMSLRSRDFSPVSYEPQTGLTTIAIPPGSYIADVMHIIVKSNNVVVFDRHDDGPTLSDLGSYFRDFLHAPINIVSLYNQDLRKDLEDMVGQFRKVELGFLSNQIAASKSGLLSSAVGLFRGVAVPTISIGFGMGRTGARDEYLPSELQDEAMDIAGEAGELVERMKITGRRHSTGKIDSLNILRQRIGNHLEFKSSDKTDTMPDPDDAFAKLEEMYRDCESQGLIKSSISTRQMFRP